MVLKDSFVRLAEIEIEYGSISVVTKYISVQIQRRPRLMGLAFSYSVVYKFSGARIQWRSDSVMLRFSGAPIRLSSYSMVLRFSGSQNLWCSDSVVFRFNGAQVQ